jgi:hypothetical protein
MKVHVVIPGGAVIHVNGIPVTLGRYQDVTVEVEAANVPLMFPDYPTVPQEEIAAVTPQRNNSD